MVLVAAVGIGVEAISSDSIEVLVVVKVETLVVLEKSSGNNYRSGMVAVAVVAGSGGSNSSGNSRMVVKVLETIALLL